MLAITYSKMLKYMPLKTPSLQTFRPGQSLGMVNIGNYIIV
jgi:hypothetical protein